MSFISYRLIQKIRQLSKELPTPMLNSLHNLLLYQWSSKPSSQDRKNQIIQHFPKAYLRQTISELLDIWQQDHPDWNGQSIALALETASYCENITRQELAVELVWTGPKLSRISSLNAFRRTDQTLLQMINEAQHEIMIVSFAIYNIPEINRALIYAIQRGIILQIILETPDSGDGKVFYDGMRSLDPLVAQKADFFIWPKHNRLIDDQGRFGSLHIKCSVVDNKHLFVSSANLTGYALELNMELGLLVHSQEMACQVKTYFDGLIMEGVLVKIESNLL